MKQLFTLVLGIFLLVSLASAHIMSGGDLQVDIVVSESTQISAADTKLDLSFNYFLLYTLPEFLVTNPPDINITHPSDGATINGTLWINWSVSDIQGNSFLVNISLTNGTILAQNIPEPITYYNWTTTDMTDGTYILVVKACENETAQGLCGDDSITVYVDNIVVDADTLALASLAVAIIFISITLLFAILTVVSSKNYLKIGFGMMTFLLITADFYLGRTVIQSVSPTSADLINVLDVLYSISVRIFIFLCAALLIYIIFYSISYLYSSKDRKRKDREMEFLGLK